MEISSPITTIVFLFLLLLTTPCFASKGGSENGGMDSSDQVYEIDYRGPETHSSHLSPPDHSSHGRPWIIHTQPKRPPLTLSPAPKPHKTGKVGARY